MPEKMTMKQVKAFIEDGSNWKTVTDTMLVQIRMLDYGSVHYASVAIKRVVNIAEILLHGAAPVTGFTIHSYHRYDPELNCFRDTVSKTAMEKEIFEESRKED